MWVLKVLTVMKNKWFIILLSFAINWKWKHNYGIGSDGNDSVINRDRVNLILGYLSSTLTNLYCRYQLTKNWAFNCFRIRISFFWYFLPWFSNTDIWIYQEKEKLQLRLSTIWISCVICHPPQGKSWYLPISRITIAMFGGQALRTDDVNICI